jgi:hypothetical protein
LHGITVDRAVGGAEGEDVAGKRVIDDECVTEADFVSSALAPVG